MKIKLDLKFWIYAIIITVLIILIFLGIYYIYIGEIEKAIYFVCPFIAIIYLWFLNIISKLIQKWLFYLNQ